MVVKSFQAEKIIYQTLKTPGTHQLKKDESANDFEHGTLELGSQHLLMVMTEMTRGKGKMNALQELLMSFEEKFEWIVANIVILHGK